MTENPAGASGAVDLSQLAAAPGVSAGALGTPPGPRDFGSDPVVRVVDQQTFGEAVNSTMRVPAVLVLHSGANPATGAAVEVVADAARGFDGRLQVFAADVDTSPQIAAALQAQSVPAGYALLQGQPMPLFQGVPDRGQLSAVLQEVLTVAVQNGVTGRIDIGPADEEVEQDNPLLDEAFEAIEAGDLDAASAAYTKVLAANPKDEGARLGLAQVGLLRRTAGIDPQQARAAAAANPVDVDAAIVVADLDVLGGHVDDAFNRLLDLVRSTTDDERDQAKNHLLELLDVVGSHDPRVKKARTSLMSALF
ncbi:MAG: co-chaperone YbbN [Nostocoides sp.]